MSTQTTTAQTTTAQTTTAQATTAQTTPTKTRTTPKPPTDTTHPRTRNSFHKLKLLIGTYTTISALTLIAIVLMRHNSAVVNSAVWTRGTIVTASALLTSTFTVFAARGARWAFLRLRIISVVMVVAVAAIVAVPGTFPVWMKVEQGFCGLLLIGVAAIVNGRYLRSLFAAK